MNTVQGPKRVAVIGATGSVGSAALDVCRQNKNRLKVCALAANSDVDKLESLAIEFDAHTLYLANQEASQILKNRFPGKNILSHGGQGLKEIAADPDIDHIVFASSGTDAIEALQAALFSGKEISLANKESIVVAGPWVMPLIKNNMQLRPLDSEHNAIWQCLHGEIKDNLKKIYLTASGGPFREWKFEDLRHVTPEEALRHPVWNMGAKISIDSATLMNKGIELIEARYLFGLEPKQVDALISPGSFVHGLVEFEDGCVKMLAGAPDMRLPAASCFFWPERLPPSPFFGRSQLADKKISFEEPDEKRFPALRIAKCAMAEGGAYPSLLVGADEMAVDSFLKREIPFTFIAEAVERTLSSYKGNAPASLCEALEIMQWGRECCSEICRAYKGT